MMNRFNTSSLPTAATFFGRQTSEDDIEPLTNEMGSLSLRKKSSRSPDRNQPKEKQPPTRSLSFRNLTPTLSWNKRFGGLQRSNSKAAFGRKVDDESREAHPRLRNSRSNSQSSNLKAPPPYALEHKPTLQSFGNVSSNTPRPFNPSQHMYVHEARPTQLPPRPHVVPGSIKKPNPNSMETGRVPHTTSPFAGRFGSTSQGYAAEPQRQRPHQLLQKQHSFRRDISTVSTSEHRPQKPHRQDSRPVMNQQQHHHHQYQGHNYHQQYHQGSNGYQTQQQQKHFYPYIQGNGSLSPTRSWHNQNANSNTSSLQDDLYRKESYKNFNYSNVKKLKPPPASSLPGATFVSRSSMPSQNTSPSRSPSRSGGAATPVMMEIYPGVEEVLRGAEETSRAMASDFLTSCECLVCTAHHKCIADAAYVVCPLCKTVSQVENRKLPHSTKPYGLGLGFVPEDEGSTAATVPGAQYMY